MHSLSALASLLAAVLMCGCSLAPSKTVLNKPAQRNPALVVDTHLQSPISGTFRVTYIPLAFSEPKEIRDARDKQISGLITLALEKKGMKLAVEDQIPDYYFSYYYDTFPDFQGGYQQKMTIRVSWESFGPIATADYHKWGKLDGCPALRRERRPMRDPEFENRLVPGTTRTNRQFHPLDFLLNGSEVWSGELTYSNWPDRDITPLFGDLIFSLLEQFPEKQ